MSSNPLVKSKKNVSPLRRTPFLKREPDSREPRDPSSSLSNGQNAPNTLSRPSTSSSLNSTSNNNNSNEASSTTKEFKLHSCTAEEIKGLRHHILRFHTRRDALVDPVKDFTPPIRLHRKDPRNLQNQVTLPDGADAFKRDSESPGPSSDGLKQGDAPTTSKPEVDMSVVAPDGGARKARTHPFQKKTRQVNSVNEASRKLRYEEYYPWVMEDFDGKNTWVGSYEAAQSDTYVLFVFDADGFKMVPAEKWYKMTPRNKFATLTADEAEQQMEKKKSAPRWIMKHIQQGQAQETSRAPTNRRGGRFKTVDGVPESTSGGGGGSGFRQDDDGDEIDFDEEFADDEEAPIMDGNEDDVKEVEKKIKKEQRTAPALGGLDNPADQDDLDDDEAPKIDKEGRRTKKYLRSLEMNANYDSDEEENPYASEDEDSDDELDESYGIKQEDSANSAGQHASTGLKSVPRQSASTLLLAKDLKPFVKKQINNLPRGMVVLQLHPQLLGDFPRNVWNINAKRRREVSDLESGADVSDTAGSGSTGTKKIKLRLAGSVSPPPQASKSPTPELAQLSSNNAGANSDPNILTEDDVRNAIKARKITAKELLAVLKPKLKKHEQNHALLKVFVKKLAKLHDGILVLKEADESQ